MDERSGKKEVALQEAIAADPGMQLLTFADAKEPGAARLEDAKECDGVGGDGAAKHVREASEGVVASAAFGGDGDQRIPRDQAMEAEAHRLCSSSSSSSIGPVWTACT
jgi:hypothetical protein